MDRYSRKIALLKVILPLASLALLSTMFLIAKQVTTEPAMPFTQRDIDARLRGQTVTAPHFAGMTPAGHELTISATEASPGNRETAASATAIVAEVRMKTGGRVQLFADEARIRPGQNTATLQGNVHIISANDLRIDTDRLETALSVIMAYSPEDIQATGPFGDLHAGRMQMYSDQQTGTIFIEFTKGVSLVYDPAKKER